MDGKGMQKICWKKLTSVDDLSTVELISRSFPVSSCRLPDRGYSIGKKFEERDEYEERSYYVEIGMAKSRFQRSGLLAITAADKER
jgi:hypothetical protein